MSEYKNPRPSATTSAASPGALYDNTVTFNKLLNEYENQTTYEGRDLISWQKAIELFGFGVASFDFATGGTLDSKNQLIRNSDGLLYRYIGASSFPLTVTAGTNPVVNPDWEAFAATAHNLLSGINPADGSAHNADDIGRGTSNVDEDLKALEVNNRFTVQTLADLKALDVEAVATGQVITLAEATGATKYNISASAPSDAIAPYVEMDDGRFAVMVAKSDSRNGAAISLMNQSAKASSGVFSWWTRPVFESHYYLGQMIGYYGHVDGTTGNQMVSRIHLESGKIDTKVVNTGQHPDDHNAPCIKILPNGKIMIACAGHQPPISGDENILYWDVFNTWGDVGQLTQSFDFGYQVTYAQIFTLPIPGGFRTYLLTRKTTQRWAMVISDDGGETWIKEGDPWSDSPSGLFRTNLLASSAQMYVIPQVIDRKQSPDFSASSNDQFCRFYIAYNPSNPSSPDANIRTAMIRVRSDGRHELVTASGTKLIGAGETDIDGVAATTIYTAPAGKTARLLDAQFSDDLAIVICEADETTFDNPEYKLVIGVDAASYTIPVAVGEAQPWPMYYPGACFENGKTAFSASNDRVVLYTITNDGLGKKQQINKCVFSRGRWDVSTVLEQSGDAGDLARIAPSSGGLAAFAVSRYSKFGPNYPQYQDFDGAVQVFTRDTDMAELPPLWLDTGVSSRFQIHNDGTVEIWGSGNFGLVSSGTIDFPFGVRLQNIIAVSFNDNNSEGDAVHITTSGVYPAAPIASIDWQATPGSGVPATFSWHIKGNLLRQSGFPAF